MNGHRFLLGFDALPVDPCEKGVRFKRVVSLHAKSCLRLQLKQLVDERLEILVLEKGRPFKLATKNLVEDNHLSAAEEGRFSAGHLV